MKLIRFGLSIAFLLGGFLPAAAQPVRGDNPLMADPSIFFENGVYYLYGTGGRKKGQGFMAYHSRDAKVWKSGGLVLRKGDSFGSSGFWAPQVFPYRERYYMAYTASEHIAIASADSPAGPFRQQQIKALDPDHRMIDPFVFFDPSGKVYLYHVRLEHGNRIFVAELNADLNAIIPGTLKECIQATLPWEDTRNSSWKVAEGPTVIKHKELYYLLYSANDFRNPDYAVGYAVAKNPTGPFRKMGDGPLLSRKETGLNGTGHGDIYYDHKGQMYYVFHVHNSPESVAPRKTAVIKLDFIKGADGVDRLRLYPQSLQWLKVVKD
ncbi:glycoside hydrolase family 43 protein [Niabella terrae]